MTMLSLGFIKKKKRKKLKTYYLQDRDRSYTTPFPILCPMSSLKYSRCLISSILDGHVNSNYAPKIFGCMDLIFGGLNTHKF